MSDNYGWRCGIAVEKDTSLCAEHAYPADGSALPPVSRPTQNTDRELWREPPGDYYAASLFVTEGGGIGMQVGGLVFVKPIRDWHQLASVTPVYTGEDWAERAEALERAALRVGPPPEPEEVVKGQWVCMCGEGYPCSHTGGGPPREPTEAEWSAATDELLEALEGGYGITPTHAKGLAFRVLNAAFGASRGAPQEGPQ
jgi:hypothetical protein